MIEEVINIPPLKKLELTGEVAWKIAVRDTKRYEVAAVQGKRVVKARYKVREGKKKQRETTKEKENKTDGREQRKRERSKSMTKRGKGAGKKR